MCGQQKKVCHTTAGFWAVCCMYHLVGGVSLGAEPRGWGDLPTGHGSHHGEAIPCPSHTPEKCKSTKILFRTLELLHAYVHTTHTHTTKHLHTHTTHTSVDHPNVMSFIINFRVRTADKHLTPNAMWKGEATPYKGKTYHCIENDRQKLSSLVNL